MCPCMPFVYERDGFLPMCGRVSHGRVYLHCRAHPTYLIAHISLCLLPFVYAMYLIICVLVCLSLCSCIARQRMTAQLQNDLRGVSSMSLSPMQKSILCADVYMWENGLSPGLVKVFPSVGHPAGSPQTLSKRAGGHIHKLLLLLTHTHTQMLDITAHNKHALHQQTHITH